MIYPPFPFRTLTNLRICPPLVAVAAIYTTVNNMKDKRKGKEQPRDKSIKYYFSVQTNPNMGSMRNLEVSERDRDSVLKFNLGDIFI
jgi:hypothetical protein